MTKAKEIKCPKCGASEIYLTCREKGFIQRAMGVKNGRPAYGERTETSLENPTRILSCGKCDWEVDYELGEGNEILFDPKEEKEKGTIRRGEIIETKTKEGVEVIESTGPAKKEDFE